MSKRRKITKKNTSVPKTEFIELGTASRNRNTSFRRNSIPDSILVQEEKRLEIEKNFNKNEEIVSTILSLWYNDNLNNNEKENIISDKLCNYLNYMYLTPVDPDNYIFVSIAYLSHLIPDVFAYSKIIKNCCGILQSIPSIDSYLIDNVSSLHNPFRRNASIPLLISSILYNSHKNKDEWPLTFIQCYMEDAFNLRIWVDAEYARLFILNILTAIPRPYTIDSSLPLLNSVRIIAGIPDSVIIQDNLIQNRWQDNQKGKIENFIVEMVEFHEKKRNENLINFIKTLCSVISVAGARHLGSKYLEEWITDVNISRYGKEFFKRLVYETHNSLHGDYNIVKNIIKLKVKGSIQSVYYENVNIILQKNHEYPFIALSTFIEHELTLSQPNFRLMSIIFKYFPEYPENYFAKVCQSIISNENRSYFYQFLKRIQKIPLRDIPTFDFVQFIIGLCNITPDTIKIITKNDNWFLQIADIICLSCFLVIPPSFEGKDGNIYKSEFQMKVSTIQRYGIEWCYKIATEHLCSINLIKSLIHQILFLNPIDSYSSYGYSTDITKQYVLTLQNEIPLNEITTTHILLLSLDRLLSNIKPIETLEILIILVSRSAKSINPLSIDNPNIIDNIYKLCTFSSPLINNTGVSWVVTELYWKACLLILIIAVFNPKIVGNIIWESNKTIKVMMEMCIMRKFENLSYFGENEQKYKIQCENIYESIKKQSDSKVIIEFISSNQIMIFPPDNCYIQIPITIINSIINLNNSLHLSKLLCSSRLPDFLVDIMQRQSPERAVSWLIPIIKDDSAALSNLPASALIHILFAYIDTENSKIYSNDDILLLLLEFIKYFEDSDPIPTLDVLRLLLNDLSTLKNRYNAKKACSLIFNSILMNSKSIKSDIIQSPVKPTLNRISIVSPTYRSPIRPITTDNLRLSSNRISQDKFNELDKQLKRQPSLLWLEELKKLKHFNECKDQLFDILQILLFYEDNEHDFYQLYLFLQELIINIPQKQLNFACILSEILIKRKIISYRIFQSPKIYKNTLYCLWKQVIFNNTNSSNNESLPDNFINVILPSNDSIIIHKLIISGLINLICISSKYSKIIACIGDDDSDFNEFFITIITKLFGNKKTPQYNNTSLVSINNSFDLICSKEKILYECGIYYYSNYKQLFELLKYYGLSLDCVSLLLSRLLTEISSSELQTFYNELDISIKRLIQKQLSLYISLNVEKAKELLTILSIKNIEKKNIDSSPFIQLNNNMDIEIIKPKKDLFNDFRNLKHNNIKLLILLFFNINTIISKRDNFIDMLLIESKNNSNNKDIILFISYILQELSILLSQKEYKDQLLNNIYKKPNILFQFITGLSLSIKYINNSNYKTLLNEFCTNLYNEINNIYSNINKRKGNILLILSFLEEYNNTNTKNMIKDNMLIDNNIETYILSMIKDKNIWKIEEYLSDLILSNISSLLPILLSIIYKIPKSHPFMGLLLDSIETCYGITNNHNTDDFYKIIFSRSNNDSKSFSLVLLSMILHHGSWFDMKECCLWIFSLSTQNHIEYLDYTNILDFLQSYIFHPKSWNGYIYNDELKPNSLPNYILSYNSQNIFKIIEFILGEQRNNINNISLSNTLLSIRLNFLYKILLYNQIHLQSILLYLIDFDNNISQNELKAIYQIRSLIYLSFPSIIYNNGFLLTENELLQGSLIKESQLDLTLHRLLKTLLDTNLCEISYKILSNIAIQHKELFIRYLPIMTALINGRSYMSVTTFIEKQFYRVFMHCLNIIDLLRPEIFTCNDLDDFLQCYYNLLSNIIYSYHISIIPLIDKFISFLCYYSLYNCEKLYNKLDILYSLKKQYKEIPKIQLLINIIKSKGKNAKSSLLLFEKERYNTNIQELKESIMIWKQNINNNYKKSSNLYDESIKYLEKLNKESINNPFILKDFINELLEIIKSLNIQLRNIGYSLLLRYIHYNPSSSNIIIPKYLECLNHSSIIIQANALQYAHEFFFYAQDYTSDFLQRLFDIGSASAPVFKSILTHSTMF